MSPRVGVVVVSHSAPLADAVVDLAMQMVADDPPPIAVAGGAEDGGFGTDAMAVMAAIESVASEAGVLVVMDLGSALMSAEMALEFLDDLECPVRLTSAPLVEGVVAAVVQAAGGSDLDDVASEASQALVAKRQQVGDQDDSSRVSTRVSDVGDDAAPGGARSDDHGPVGGEPTDADTTVAEVTLVNEHGLHARPAAAFVREAARHDAEVLVSNVTTGTAAGSASSMLAVASLGAAAGHVVRIRATGPDADAAVAALVSLVDGAFGEPRVDGVVTDVVPGEDVADAPSPARDDDRPGEQSAADTSADGPDAQRPAWAVRRVPALGISNGRAVGPVRTMAPPPAVTTSSEPVAEPDRPGEVQRLVAAVEEVSASLQQRAADAADEAMRDVLEATAMLAADPALVAPATTAVRDDGTHPAVAVAEAADAMASRLADGGDYMKARARDVRDVRDRVVAVLLDQPMPGIPRSDEPFVLVADDLAPADTALLGASACVALVTRDGGPTSHTAIIARSLGLPAVVAGSGVDGLADGVLVLVDGTLGRVVVDPTPAQVETASQPAEPIPAFSGTGRTADGTSIALLVNVGNRADVDAGIAARAEGVGLVRTEFMFLDRQEPPSRKEQEEAYRSLLTPFEGRKVVVRTLDAGSDKPLPFVSNADEPNPSLGVRGLRTAHELPGLLDVQLDAIAAAAASTDAEVQVMAPMVATTDEAAMFAAACAEYGLVPGVMIETPAAALMADHLLDHVAFLSIGTNDLGQYTMAADRLLGAVATLNDPWQPAVLKLIANAAAAAGQRGAPIGVCGEAAADPALAVVLAGMGVTSLSMAPSSLAAVAVVLAGTELEKCRSLASAAAGAATATAARNLVRDDLHILDRHGL